MNSSVVFPKVIKRVSAVALVTSAFAVACMPLPGSSSDGSGASGPRGPNGGSESAAPTAGFADSKRSPGAKDAATHPLCRIQNSCLPDDTDGTASGGYGQCPPIANTSEGDAGVGFASGPSTWAAAASPPPRDAGTSAPADGGTARQACRVRRDPVTGALRSRCEAESAQDSASSTVGLPGIDGTACLTGQDCAVGFDCIKQSSGERVCRKYCCARTCEPATSNDTTRTKPSMFCDIQALADIDAKVPVCMRIQACTLLRNGDCASGQSCMIVNDSGDTACVDTGPRREGASCEVDNCAQGLTCLGQVGSRECFRLCRVDGNDCDITQVCATNTLFTTPSVGVCQARTSRRN